MLSPRAACRTLAHRVREVIHPLVDSFLPVTYTAREFVEHKRRLDPEQSRSRAQQNTQSDRRLIGILHDLGIDEPRATTILGEARRVRLHPVSPCAKSDLASPMCSEDRYAVYGIVRALRPHRVIETGIAHGASSTYILSALAANDADDADGHRDAVWASDALGGHSAATEPSSSSAHLISIDRSDDPRIGQMVPHDLRDRWTVHIGDSLEHLPNILGEPGSLDLFIHDSLHTYAHMRAEFELAWPRLRPGGVLLAHDILQTNAFPRFVRQRRKETDLVHTSINLGLVRRRLG